MQKRLLYNAKNLSRIRNQTIDIFFSSRYVLFGKKFHENNLFTYIRIISETYPRIYNIIVFLTVYSRENDEIIY